jgi:hypothetical protein
MPSFLSLGWPVIFATDFTYTKHVHWYHGILTSYLAKVLLFSEGWRGGIWLRPGRVPLPLGRG